MAVTRLLFVRSTLLCAFVAIILFNTILVSAEAHAQLPPAAPVPDLPPPPVARPFIPLAPPIRVC